MKRNDLFLLASTLSSAYLVIDNLPRASVFMRNFAMLDTKISTVTAGLYITSFLLLFYSLRLVVDYLELKNFSSRTSLVQRSVQITIIQVAVVIFIQLLMSRM